MLVAWPRRMHIAPMNPCAGSPPVLLLAFNRPLLVRRVLAVLSDARPARLYVAVDGPRASHPDDGERCDEVRQVIERGVAWPCEVRSLFRESNVGLQKAIVSGVDWFFEHEAAGVILEDDCVPAPAFLPFAAELLETYRDTPSVMHISGVSMRSPSRERAAPAASYAFAGSGHVWGWATWRRAWRAFEPTLAAWPRVREQYRHAANPLRRALAHKFASAHAGRKWTWSRAWYWTIAQQQGLAIIPAVNLVENVGTGPDATHQHGSRHPLRQRAETTLAWPLVHPPHLERDAAYDRLLARYHRGSWRRRLSDGWWALQERWA